MKLQLSFFSMVLFTVLLFGQDPMADASRAQEELAQGNVDSAESLYQSALDMDPSFSPALLGLSKVALTKGDLNATGSYLREAIDMEPENQEFRDEYQKLNELNTLMSQGNRSYSNGETSDAIETFRIILEKYPTFSEAAFRMGLAYSREGNTPEAVESFKTALRIYPDHENAQKAIKNEAKRAFLTGNDSYKRGDLETALGYYKKAIQVDETFYQSYYQMGVIESKLGNDNTAIENYQRALEIEPGFYKGWFAMGKAQERTGNQDAALDSYNKALEVYPTYAKAYGAIGDIHFSNQNFDAALSAFQQGATIDVSYAKAFIGMGSVYLEQELFQDAITPLETASVLKAKDAMVWFRLASAYNGVVDCENAKRTAREATALRPKFGGGWYELGVAEWCGGKGNKTAALNALERGRNDRNWRPSCEHLIKEIRTPK